MRRIVFHLCAGGNRMAVVLFAVAAPETRGLILKAGLTGHSRYADTQT